MTNDKFIKIIMQNNEIRISKSKFGLLGYSFTKANSKIDTGCSYSTIPLFRLDVPESKRKELKRQDVAILINELHSYINNGMQLKDAVNIEKGKLFKLSYGVETGGMKHKEIDFLSEQDLMDEPAISFKHIIKNIEFNNVKIPDREIFVNYDRKGNILIGMDILKDWDIHIGTIDTGETIFLGCPKDQINDEYLQEFENTFNIASSINALNIR